MQRYYTRVCNFYYGRRSKSLVKKGKTLPLNGNLKISFDKIEIISRKSTKIVSIKEINNLPRQISKIVKKDISNSLNFINKEGIIVLDDYKLKGWWNDGVTRAIDYFIKTKKIKILEQHNLINYHHQCILQKI